MMIHYRRFKVQGRRPNWRRCVRADMGPVLSHMAAMADPDCRPLSPVKMQRGWFSPLRAKRARIRYGQEQAWCRAKKPRRAR